MFIGQMSINPESTKMLEIKFVGKYRTGRAPCEWLPDGSRRWARTTGFKITKLINGDLKVTYVEINYDFNKKLSTQLEDGQEYFVTIKLTKNRATELGISQVNTMMTYRNPVKNEEIIKIKKKPK